MSRAFLVLAFISALLLAGCSFSLAQDVTPPPDSQLSGENVATAIPSFTDPPPSTDAPSVGDGEQSADQPVTIDASGTMKNGSGGKLPVGAEISLFAYDHSQGQDLFTRTAALDENHEFHFDELPLTAMAVYQASVEYQGLTYFSEPLTMTDLQAGKEFELIVYDGTQETSALSIGSLNLVFYFQTDGKVKVIEQVLLSNSGHLAVVPTSNGQALLRYEIPPEASNVAFQKGQIGDRYEWAEGGFVDYRAVLPGEDSYEVIYSFDMSYNRGLEFSRAVEFKTDNVHIFLSQNDIKMEGDNLTLVGEQLLDGDPYRVYQLNRELKKSEVISVRLSGTNPLAPSFLERISNNGLIVGVTALGIALGLGGYLLRRTFTAAAHDNSEEILDEIVLLDKLFEKKKISKIAYERKRDHLKQRLERALKKGGKS